MARAITVKCPLGDDKFVFRRLSGTEELGRLFEYQLELFSEDHAINATDLLGLGLTIKIACADDRERFFHGYVCEFCQSGIEYRQYAGYRVVLRPLLWFLSRTADCRIFQQQQVPDILQAVFDDNQLSDLTKSLSGTYRSWEYCVQYCETDFHFVSRLMEQEGIYYFFQYEDGNHTLVLADASSSHASLAFEDGSASLPFRTPVAHYDADHIFEWEVTQQVQAGTFVHTDFDFEQPSANLEAKGAVSRSHAKADGELFHYPGKYLVAADGETYARSRINELHTNYEVVRGQADAVAFTVGGLFTLQDHPRADQNREYLITSATYDVSQEIGLATAKADQSAWDPRVHCHFTAISSQQTFRPARLTPKAVVRGPQTAVVVGKQGEEIWTDKYGRVKVKFRWDRLSKSDENSSCWVRVAQVWAGKNWGAMHIPRIGQEVIVDFLEGDPDQPIITGRVYNADQMPPYTLPDNKTQSGLKSRSTKQGDATTFNELRFEDLKDSEEIYFHAEKNFQRIVENNDTLKIGFEKKDKGDQTIEIHNNQKLVVGNTNADDGSQTIEIWKNRTATVKEGNEKLEVQKGNRDVIVTKGNDTHQVTEGNRTVTVAKGNDTHQVQQGNREVTVSQGNDTLTVTQGNLSIKITAGKATLEAGTSIELKVGASSIKIEPAKITLKAPQIAIQADAQVEMKGPLATVSADAMLTLKGGLIKIN